MKRLHQLILRCSQNGWLFLGALLGFALTLFALLQVGERFAAVTQGAEPFDLQNGLTLTAIFAQLPTYTDQSRRLYLLFTLIDYLFPLCAGLWVAGAAAFFVRHTLPVFYQRVVERRGFLLLLLPTFFDWAENLTSAALIYLAPTAHWLATLVLLCKQAKLATLNVTQGVLLLLGLYYVGVWWRKRQPHGRINSG
ncbi:MAG: hypothetical protein DYG89_14180 [Caldilinea sp. CFX5]|nr:hypothetical protein [Caldilinea sp. CFX5]